MADLPPGVLLLERLASLLAASPDDGDQRWAGRIERWLRGDGSGSADELLGLQGEPGGPGWRTAAALDRRDAALRTAAREFDLSPPELTERLARYAAGSWPRERHLAACPAWQMGKVEAHLWAALRERDRLLGERQMRDILRRSAPDQNSAESIQNVGAEIEERRFER